MNQRERELVTVLADCVRVLSEGQVGETWWSGNRWGRQRTRDALRRLVREGWLLAHPALVRRPQIVLEPIATWRPGAEVPDFHELSRVLIQRSRQPLTQTTIYSAAEKSVSLFGRGRLATLRLTQMTHDVAVGQVFLRYRQRGLDPVRWIGEDHLPPTWLLPVKPDALVTDAEGVWRTAVEYGGAYLPQRLIELDAGLARLNEERHPSMRCELW